MHFAELSKCIDTYLVPQALEKKSNAEVSTPFALRRDMLDKIPAEFWTSPHTVFEPCAGKGGFLIDIIDRFMSGLAASIPDERQRYKTIVEDCLYFSDINATNIFICRLLIDPCGEYKVNCNEGNTLGLDVAAKWGLGGFDAVIGNPPYNSSGNTGTGNTIWQDFTKKSLVSWIIPGGYLAFVHPPGWRKPNTVHGRFYGLYRIMTSDNQMRHLSIHGISDGKKTFNCGTRYDWYVIEKRQKYTSTTVYDEHRLTHTVDLSALSWLPNANFATVRKILAGPGDAKCPVIYSRSAYGSDNKKHISHTRTDLYTYPVIHTIPLRGIRYIYSSTNTNGHFGISKVIFGDNGLNGAVIDMAGTYGMSENSIAIHVADINEANNIQAALLCAAFKDIIRSCIIGNFRIDWRLFAEFKRDFWRGFV